MEINHEQSNKPLQLKIGVKEEKVKHRSFIKYHEVKELRTILGDDSELSEFSQYHEPISNVNPYSIINIEGLYKRITMDDYLQKKCDRIRKASKGEERSIKSTELEYITPSGTFYKRNENDLISHSGYMCLDFDDIPDTESLKNKLIKDKELEPVLIFNSPTNTGLKVFIQIPRKVETHGQYFDAVRNYVKHIYVIEIDKSCRDVSRACFLSHDANAYIAPPWELKILNQEFLDKWLSISTEKKKALPPVTDKLMWVNNLIHELQTTNTDITTDYNDWVKIGWALCELGEEGRTPFHKISEFYPTYNFNEAEEKYTSILKDYNGSIKLGTLYHIAKTHKITLPALIETSTKINAGNSPRTAKQRLLDAKEQAEIQSLMGAMWQTGELHILFADTGAGKSVWSTQIADALSKGLNVFEILPNKNKPLKVLFYDFELSDKQFQKRYTDEHGKMYNFSENFFIDYIDFKSLVEDNPTCKIDDLVTNKIKADIETIEPDVLIIDNLTYLKTESTQDTSVALDLIRKLNELKRQYNLSMLVLAHTPKLKEGTPLTVNELGGSKHLSNFVDSVSAIGKSSKGSSIRYIKQVKPSRSSELIFDSSNVIVAEMKHTDGFLGFQYMDCEYEAEHMQSTSAEQRAIEKQQKKQLVLELHLQGKTCREIEQLTDVPKSTVGSWLKGK
jgi:archaellum biogenesis ATPase FlaH